MFVTFRGRNRVRHKPAIIWTSSDGDSRMWKTCCGLTLRKANGWFSRPGAADCKMCATAKNYLDDVKKLQIDLGGRL